MSSIEAIVKFVASYPTWAKVAMLSGLVLAVAIALLAPRTPIDAEAQPANSAASAGKTVSFRIHGVSISKSASVRVTAIVNGKSLVYPSLGAIDWLDVGPTMSSQTFQVPKAPQYDVRFEMDVKNGPRHVSQETVSVSALPYTGDYRLYPTKVDGRGISRAAVPEAFVRFSLE